MGATNIFSLVTEFLGRLMKIVTMEYLFLGSIGLLVLTWLVTIFRTRSSYELRLLKSVARMNKYFGRYPQIEESNLIEFNNMMRRVPATLRYRWQEYMLNRDQMPSQYINQRNCLDTPSKTSSYTNTVKACKMFTIVIAVISLLLGMGSAAIQSPLAGSNTFGSNIASVVANIFASLVIPVLVLAFGYLFIIFLNARQTAITSDLYYTFHEFERALDKACVTMPEYVDYEVLFTPKEISKGIPALEEYLEKMKIQEQKKKDEEDLAPVQYEDYEFEKLGVENSLLLDRAMMESEKYLTIKNNLTERIKDIEKKQYTLQKAFDEQTKDYERRIQASNESIGQLNEQMQNTTSKIESNYIRKRVNDEQQRLQQVLSDQDNAQQRFKKDQDIMQAEIDKYKADIEKRKGLAQEAMIAECKTYVNKVYEKVSRVALEKIEPYTQQLEEQQNELKTNITTLDNQAIEKMEVIKAMEEKLANLEHQFNLKTAEIEAMRSVKEYFTSDEFFKRVALNKKDLKEYVKSGQSERALVADKQYDGAFTDADLDAAYGIDNQSTVDQNGYELNDPAVVASLENNHEELQKALAEIEVLKQENQQLTQEKEQMLEEKKALVEEKNQVTEEKVRAEKEKEDALLANEKLETANANLTKEQDNLKKTIDDALSSISNKEKEAVQDKKVQNLKNIKISHIPYTGKYSATKKTKRTKNTNTLKNSLNKLLSTVDRLNETKTVTQNAKVTKSKKK